MTDVIRHRWQDAGIAAAVAAVFSLQVSAPFERDAVPPDWRAYTLVCLLGAALLWRRRRPVGVLAASLVILLVYYNLGFGAIGAVWPMTPALFNAALRGHWLAATGFAGSTLFGSGAWRVVVEREEATVAALVDILSEGALGAAVILAGAMVLNHRQLQTEMRAREAAVAAEREADARSRLTEQRLAIARDVHDVVAHSLAGIGVQAHLAAELLDSDGEGARRSIRAVIDTTSEAMARLRHTVGGLRGAPVAESLADVVSGVHGVEVELVREHTPEDPNGPVESTIRAIVREALTNVVRHSGASRVTVTVTDRPGCVVVSVVDDGRGGSVVEGNGIRGMRERARALGGTLRVQPVDESGMAVTAELPTR